MLGKLQARVILAALTAAVVWPAGLARADNAEVTVSQVSASFFPNPTNSGAFTATVTTPVAFTMDLLNINFNPPRGTVACKPDTGVEEHTRPFTAVEPQPDGSCRTRVAEGNGQQAGQGSLYDFDAVFTGAFSLPSAGQVEFDFYSDDGWILSIGPNQSGKQPTYVSGQLLNPPSAGPFTRLPVIGAYNVPSSPAPNKLVVSFPDSGNFPFEIDYTECCTGELALTLTANGKPIRNTAQPPPTTGDGVDCQSTRTAGADSTPVAAAQTSPDCPPAANPWPVIILVGALAVLGVGIADNFRRAYS